MNRKAAKAELFALVDTLTPAETAEYGEYRSNA